MRRTVLSFFMFFTVAGMLIVNTSQAAAREGIEDALKARYRLSRVEIQDWRTEGRVRDLGGVLTLQTDGVPANKFWVVTPPRDKIGHRRIHMFRYAAVEIAPDGRLKPAPADFTLPKGTRLVVLDVKVRDDRVHISTHTLEPVRLPDGDTAYGCTEFVFPFDPGALARGDLSAIQGRIEQWLPLAPKPQSAASR